MDEIINWPSAYQVAEFSKAAATLCCALEGEKIPEFYASKIRNAITMLEKRLAEGEVK